MSEDFLAQFRRRLHDWLQLRLAGGQLPFRRVEEAPQWLRSGAGTAPDLVLWINRDSLLAGAMLLIPARVEPAVLEEGVGLAGSVGLCQFTTWGPHSVDIWEVVDGQPRQVRSWEIPAAGRAGTEAFTAVFEQLLQAMKNLAVPAMLPAEQLPPHYFVNLCRLVLRDIEPALLEAARVAARPGQPDACTLRQARGKGWLSLWRLLALLRHERLPRGIDPERLERTFGYALAELPPALFRQQFLADDEPPLPESAAIRLHHLAGRLSQLGWSRDAPRARLTLERLLAETARDCLVDTTPPSFPLRAGDLLVNHLPPELPAGTMLVAPRPCLAGLALTAEATGCHLPEWLAHDLSRCPTEARPERIVAFLHDAQPFPAHRRRDMLAALRHPWPYRRFPLSASPAWVWEALYLGGIVDVEGVLQITLPPGWPTAPGIELLWQALTERLSPAELRRHDSGMQTLLMVGHHRAPDRLLVRDPDGSCRQLPPLADPADLATLARIAASSSPVAEDVSPARRARPRLAERIAASVFRDGLPRFPGDYLRRIDATPMRRYRLSGALQTDSHFFGRIRLRSAAGEIIDAENSVDAEALQLAAYDGRTNVDLPLDPQLTTQLIAAYRSDLHRLWRALMEECLRHHPAQRQALALARRLWREQGLPPRDPG